MHSTRRPTVYSPSSDCTDLAGARGEFLAILYKTKAYTRDLRMLILKSTVGLNVHLAISCASNHVLCEIMCSVAAYFCAFCRP